MDGNMTTENSLDYEDQRSEGVDDVTYESLKVASLLVYSLVFGLGVSGNGLVIWVTGFRMKTTVNTVWYLNLATADFLFASFLPLIIAERALDGHWPFGWFMCKVYHSVLYLNMFASVYFLAVISLDRCALVVWPVATKNHRSVRKASWVALGVWVLALVLSSPYFVFMDTGPYQGSPDTTFCFPNYDLTDPYSNGSSTAAAIQSADFRAGALIVARVLMGFALPFAVIVSCYSVIVCRLRRNHSLARRRSSRALKIMAAVVAAFFLCWAPFHAMNQVSFACIFWVDCGGEATVGAIDVGFDVAVCLAFLNSCLNPLLYVFMSPDFKGVFRSSVLKVLEKAFSEEPQSQALNTSTTNASDEQRAVGASRVDSSSPEATL